MNGLITYLKKEWIASLFIVLVFAVTLVHLTHRNEHFQECDSTLVYEDLYNFPVASISQNSYNSQGSTISEAQARTMLDWTPVKKLLDFYRIKYHVADEKEFEARVVRSLTRLNPFSIFRLAVIVGISQIHLPFFLQSFFALPTATTYAPLVGFFYGFFGAHASYDQFMSGGLIISISLFALSVVIFFLINRKLKIPHFTNALVATTLLFSLSIASYGYHLGSTIWHVASGFVWIFCFVTYSTSPKFLKNMSCATAILIFFNYLIIIYWAGLIIALFYEKVKEGNIHPKTWFHTGWNLLRTQYLALISFFFIALIFYPPGQSYRGGSIVGNFLVYTYNIVLNFFGFYNQNYFLNFLQFFIGALLIGVGIVQIIRNRESVQSLQAKSYRLVGGVLIVYISFVLFRILGYIPSRHLLALAPIVFFLSAMALDILLQYLHIRQNLVAFIWMAVAIFGFSSLPTMIALSKDRFVIKEMSSDVEKVYLYDCSSSLAYKDWGIRVPVESIKPASFEPNMNTVYLYVSQLQPLEKTLHDVEQNKNNPKPLPRVEILNNSYTSSGTCFIGYHPDPHLCFYGFFNQLYKTKFKLLPS